MTVYDKVQVQVTKTVQNVAFHTDTGMKSWKPLVDHIIDDALLQTVPHLNQMLLQIVNVWHFRLTNVVLYRTAHLVVNKVEVGAVGRPRIGSNESQNLSLQ